MANNIFSALKSAFVTEIPDETPVVTSNKVEQKESQKVQQVQSAQPMFITTSLPQTAPSKIEGQVNESLLQQLCKAMEDSNLPGPDYLELKNVANNDDMKKAIPDETQRLTVAFITMKSSNPSMTKERVLSSIDEYIKIIENERKNGHEQLNAIWAEKVESEKENVARAEQEIIELQAKLQELLNFVQTKNNEIATTSNECNINKANFDTTVDFLVNNLTNDKTKLSNTLM